MIARAYRRFVPRSRVERNGERPTREPPRPPPPALMLIRAWRLYREAGRWAEADQAVAALARLASLPKGGRT